MKRILQIAINNDTFFLSKYNIVDYSLLIIIDKEKKVVRIGIIDYIQQYTLEKILESNFKKVWNAGKQITIVEPIEYRKRFKEAMDKYFISLYGDQSLGSFEEAFIKPLNEAKKKQ